MSSVWLVANRNVDILHRFSPVVLISQLAMKRGRWCKSHMLSASRKSLSEKKKSIIFFCCLKTLHTHLHFRWTISIFNSTPGIYPSLRSRPILLIIVALKRPCLPSAKTKSNNRLKVIYDFVRSKCSHEQRKSLNFPIWAFTIPHGIIS